MLFKYQSLLLAVFAINRVIATNDGDNGGNDGNNGQNNVGNFTIIGGQIYTPGLAILDAPQPFTPEGGDFLQVPLDITGDGKLPFPNNPDSSPTVIHNITLFLTSYITGFNFTISNATTNTSTPVTPLAINPPTTNVTPPLGNILLQEPSSTVKHVNWLWPSCLVGNGKPSQNGLGSNITSARGDYNISIHQSYRLNGTDYYTVFDLPISVTNEIPQTASSQAWGNDPAPGPAADTNGTRMSCDRLQNQLLNYTFINSSVHAPPSQPYLGGGVVVSGTSSLGNEGGGKNGSGNNGQNGAQGINSNSASGKLTLGFGPTEGISSAALAVGVGLLGVGFLALG